MNKTKRRGKRMTQQEFADFIGCSVPTLKLAINEGKITDASIDRHPSGRMIGIWSMAAKREWARNYSLGKLTSSPVHDALKGLMDSSPNSQDEDEIEFPSQTVSKNKLEYYKAELAKIELAEKEGLVGNIAEINSQLHAYGTEVRIAVEGIGAACVDEVMMAETRAEKEAAIMKASKEALRKLTEVIARDFDL